MKTFHSFIALMFLLAALSFGGVAVAQDEHGGEAVEDTNGDERVGEKADSDEKAPDEDEDEGAEEEADSDEHAGDEA
ncbi:hypothetical protein GCM10011533_02850 [Streptosporangium jomthongense]|uniref:Uncharacterized protein n=1 Tax=Marinobacter aromaticivorans TaxID=1494078 RepID=A0ABW2IR33_9GAMM|nr:hypothetical protein [Marinobacter aromaticivorans]GGE53798.1 hypothetical protein GCM10011533_02850 [Streptosporangium jomthongense]